MASSKFSGFPNDSIRFLAELENQNNKEWFNNNRDQFDTNILEPTKQFVLAMGEKLQKQFPKINAIPQIDKSIFRFHRDVRFSKDKRPFKTHVGIFFWQGNVKLESPGFYFHLEANKLLLGGGMHILSKEQLIAYREAVADDKSGPKLVKIINTGVQQGSTLLNEDSYKRVPRGYPADHPRADLLRQKGCTLGIETKVPKEIFTDSAVEFVFDRFKTIIPLHKWLLSHVADA